MNTDTSHIDVRSSAQQPEANTAKDHSKLKQWGWFIGIWTASLLCVLTLGYGIKFIMSLI